MKLKLLNLFLLLISSNYNYLYSQNLRNYVIEAVENYSQCVENKPYQLQAQFCEYATKNNVIIMYTDGFGYIFSSGRNCPVPVDNYSFLAEQIRKSNRSEQWLKQMKNIYKKTPVNSQTDFPPGWDYLLNSFRRVELEGILNPQNLGLYEIMSIVIKNDNIISVNFNHKENKQIIGQMLINSRSKKIEKLTLNGQKFFSPQLWDWTRGELSVNFQEINNKTFIKDLKIKMYVNDFQYYIHLKTNSDEIFYYSTTRTDYKILSQNDMNPFVYYDTRNFKEIACDKKIFQKVINDYGGRKELEKQFVSNANIPFYFSETGIEGSDQERKAKEIHKHLQKILHLIKHTNE